jgi:hypothetical protein
MLGLQEGVLLAPSGGMFECRNLALTWCPGPMQWLWWQTPLGSSGMMGLDLFIGDGLSFTRESFEMD